MKKIFILVGPSGSGKDTLGSFLIQEGIPELISHTTREMRKGECNKRRNERKSRKEGVKGGFKGTKEQYSNLQNR